MHTPLVTSFIPVDSSKTTMFAIISHPVGPGVILAVAYRAHKMQMRRVDAQRVVAAMIELQVVGDIPVKYMP